jgi:hypothetical protein
MTSFVAALLFTTVTVALTTPAQADEAAVPIFALMDHTGDRSHARFEVAAGVLRGAAADTLFRTSIFGQYVHPSGLGGYAGLALGVIAFDDLQGDHVGLGNLDLGSVYRRTLSSTLDVGLRAGLILPTSNRPAIGLFCTWLARPADLATVAPDATWGRFGVSPTVHAGPAALRVDVGVDIPIIDRRSLEPLWHANFGAGLAYRRFSAAAELQTVTIGRVRQHNAALSVRYPAKLSPYLAVSMPVDQSLRGEAFGIITGLTTSL